MRGLFKATLYSIIIKIKNQVEIRTFLQNVLRCNQETPTKIRFFCELDFTIMRCNNVEYKFIL